MTFGNESLFFFRYFFSSSEWIYFILFLLSIVHIHILRTKLRSFFYYSLSLQVNLHGVTICMKKFIHHILFLLIGAFLVTGCSVSKFIPEGHYLLDDVEIKSDNREVKPSQMTAYVRQTPNAKWFSLIKLPMYIYSASGKDSTKWMNRFLRKMGDAPRIY